MNYELTALLARLQSVSKTNVLLISPREAGVLAQTVKNSDRLGRYENRIAELIAEHRACDGNEGSVAGCSLYSDLLELIGTKKAAS